jgi:hypothetical protein
VDERLYTGWLQVYKEDVDVEFLDVTPYRQMSIGWDDAAYIYEMYCNILHQRSADEWRGMAEIYTLPQVLTLLAHLEPLTFRCAPPGRTHGPSDLHRAHDTRCSLSCEEFDNDYAE